MSVLYNGECVSKSLQVESNLTLAKCPPSSWVIGWGKRTAIPSPIRYLSLPRKCVFLLIYLTWMLNVPMICHPEVRCCHIWHQKICPSCPLPSLTLGNDTQHLVALWFHTRRPPVRRKSSVQCYSWRSCLAAVALLTRNCLPVLMNLFRQLL